MLLSVNGVVVDINEEADAGLMSSGQRHILFVNVLIIYMKILYC